MQTFVILENHGSYAQPKLYTLVAASRDQANAYLRRESIQGGSFLILTLEETEAILRAQPAHIPDEDPNCEPVTLCCGEMPRSPRMYFFPDWALREEEDGSYFNEITSDTLYAFHLRVPVAIKRVLHTLEAEQDRIEQYGQPALFRPSPDSWKCGIVLFEEIGMGHTSNPIIPPCPPQELGLKLEAWLTLREL